MNSDEPDEFQRKLVTVERFFAAAFRDCWGDAPKPHEFDTNALVDLVYVESGGSRDIALTHVEDMFSLSIAYDESLFECWVLHRWWVERNRPMRMTAAGTHRAIHAPLPNRRRQLLEREIHERAALAVRLEREREERVRRSAR